SDVCSSDLYLRNYVISVLLRNGIDTFGRGSTLRTRAQSRRARGGGHVDRAHGGEGGGHVEGSRRILRDGTIIGSRGLRPRPPRRQGHVLALHGLVDHLGDGVTYTGYTTPPGGEAPVGWQVGMSGQGLQEIDFAESAGCLAALGHPVRIQLLQATYEGTTTVAELARDERFGTSGQIYHHVHALAGAGWLESARRGHWRVPATRIVPPLTLLLIGTH